MSKETVTNTWKDGLNKDLNPMITPNTVLTDNLNGTLITYNGNEFSLQNDMGNVKKGYLSEGFYPIGVTEFGGIMYFVSVNENTNEFEIGSYPSLNPETHEMDVESDPLDLEFQYRPLHNLYTSVPLITYTYYFRSDDLYTALSEKYHWGDSSEDDEDYPGFSSWTSHFADILNSEHPEINFNYVDSLLLFQNGEWSSNNEENVDILRRYVYNYITQEQIECSWEAENSETQTGTINTLEEFRTSVLNTYDKQHPVTIEVQPSYDGSVNLILTDDKNPPRLINSGFAVIGDGKGKFTKRNQNVKTNYYDESSLDVQSRLINISTKFTHIELGEVSKNEFGKWEVVPNGNSGIQFGGELKGGNYTFYLKYGDDDGNKTDVICESGIISVFKGTPGDPLTMSGAFANEKTDKSIYLTIQDIDVNYSNIYLYYTREYCDTNGYRLVEAKSLIDPYKTDSETKKILISGLEREEDISIEELNIAYYSISSAKAIAQQQNMLFLGNTKQEVVDSESLQKLSYEIKVAPCIKDLAYVNPQTYETYGSEVSLPDKEYYNPYNIYYCVGYWPEEVYRFGIVYIKSDGTKTDVYDLKGCKFDNIFDSNLSGTHVLYDEDVLVDDSIFLKDTTCLDNTKGIFQMPKFNPFDFSGVYDYTKVLGITFEIPHNVINRFPSNIIGYFIVRQKRTPIQLCQGLSVGINKNSFFPTLRTGSLQKNVLEHCVNYRERYYSTLNLSTNFDESNRRVTIELKSDDYNDSTESGWKTQIVLYWGDYPKQSFQTGLYRKNDGYYPGSSSGTSIYGTYIIDYSATDQETLITSDEIYISNNTNTGYYYFDLNYSSEDTTENSDDEYLAESFLITDRTSTGKIGNFNGILSYLAINDDPAQLAYNKYYLCKINIRGTKAQGRGYIKNAILVVGFNQNYVYKTFYSGINYDYVYTGYPYTGNPNTAIQNCKTFISNQGGTLEAETLYTPKKDNTYYFEDDTYAKEGTVALTPLSLEQINVWNFFGANPAIPGQSAKAESYSIFSRNFDRYTLSSEINKSLFRLNTYSKDTIQEKAIGLLSVEAIVNPDLQSMFKGDTYSVSEFGTVNIQSKTSNYREWFGTPGDGSDVSFNAKAIYVPDNTSLKYIDNIGFSTKIGDGLSVRPVGFIDSKPTVLSDDKDRTDIIRGNFSPYIGLWGDGLLSIEKDTKLYTIRRLISDFKTEFTRVSNNNLEYFSISNKFLLDEPIDCFRGDCYINTVTVRMNRNFIDADAPLADAIVDITTWKDNYDGYLKKSTKWEKMNLTDLNTVDLGHWVTFKCLASSNLALRSLDTTNVTEFAQMGNPRGFYPVTGASTATPMKVADTTLYNDGYRATVGRIRQILKQKTPYDKNEYGTRVMFSNVATSDAFINGYRTFQGASFKDYPTQYGKIIKLLPWGNNLFCVFEHGIAIIPVNQKALMNTTTDQTIHIYGYGVLPDDLSIVSQDYGSIWADSVIKTPLGIYGVDTSAKKIWQFTDRKGLVTISDMKIQRFLNDEINIGLKSQEDLGVTNVKTHYNEYKGDVMFTFYNTDETRKEWNICYNERQGLWITRYSWLPLHSANVDNTFYTIELHKYSDSTKESEENRPFGIWKHGRTGLDNQLILPTKWYNIQEPFEFEFVAGEPMGIDKIFENLKITSNNVQPESFDFQIIGDDYLFNKARMYHDVNKEIDKNNIYGDPIGGWNTPYNTSGEPFTKQDYFYDNQNFDWAFYNAFITYDKVLDEYTLVVHQDCKNKEKHGIRLGNIQYKENGWDTNIEPLRYNAKLKNPEIELDSMSPSDPFVSAKLRDKWIKIRIKYKGDRLAIIGAVTTFENISYA